MANNPISLSELFNEWCPSIPPYTNTDYWKPIIDRYGFTLRVVVSKDIPPRHSIFSWIRGMGVSKFDEIFQGDCRLPDEWLLAFPERHCSLDEVRSLILTLVKLNEAQGHPMKHLDILTSSPYIISDSMSKCVSIIGFPEGKKTYNQDYMCF